MKYVFLLMMIIGASFCVIAGEDANPIDCESISSITGNKGLDDSSSNPSGQINK